MSRPFVIDEPVELPDGTLRCKRHHQEICGICCVDYTYMRDNLQEDDDDVDPGRYPSANEEARRQPSKRLSCAVCRKPADKQCSRCKSVYYCGSEHQVQDWKAHKNQCTKPDSPQSSTTGLRYHPLGDTSDSSDSFKRDSPIELEDGTLRCATHYLEWCPKCCVDYTFMRDILKEDAEVSDRSSDGEPFPAEELGVQNVKWNKCIICREPATKTCSRCKDVYYCSAKHQELDREAHKKQCSKTKAGQSSKPSLLLIAIGQVHKLVDITSDEFFAMIEDKVTLSRAVTAESAVRVLTSPTRPTSVIIGAGIYPKDQLKLLDPLVQYAKKGGTVVMGVGFASFTRPPDMNELFSRFGLPWKSGPWGRRLQFVLHPDEPAAKERKPGGSNRKKVRDKRPKEELLERSVNPLPYTYDMKALCLENVSSDQAIYLEHGIEPRDKDQLLETPVAFAPVGKGWVGYIGDLNDEGMSQFVLRAMIGLRVPPTETRIPSPVPSEERVFGYW